MIKNGYITGKLPTSPNNKQIIKNVHDNIAYPGLNNALLIKKPLQKNGNNNKQAIAHAIKNIPNNLFVLIVKWHIMVKNIIPEQYEQA